MQLPLFSEHHPTDHAALDACLRARVVAVDIETETRWPGHGPRHDYGLCYPADVKIIALAWREGEAIRTTALAAPFGEAEVGWLRRLFAGDAMIAAHNAVFDIRQLSRLTGGTIPERIWDTMVMAWLLHPAVKQSYGLLGVAEALGIEVGEEQAAVKEWRGRLHELALGTAVGYAENDARLALEIYERQRALEGDAELIDWECRAMREYCRMAARGIRLNIPYVERQRAELEDIQTATAERLAKDGLTAPDSPKARVKYLYQTKGIPLPEWDPDAGYWTWAGYKRLKNSTNPQVTLDDLSTRGNVIDSYVEEDSPYAEQLRDLADYSRADWLIATLDSLVEHACVDGRLHSLITIATDTGRRASRFPAMQNWKMPDMAGVAIGDDGFTLVEIDYSNAENIMAAMIAGDDGLAIACATEDFHSTMAVTYFGEAWNQADGAARRRLRGMSKRISYGTAYGMGAKRLAKGLGVSLGEAHAFLRARDKAFPKLARAKHLAEQRVRETNRLKLWSGRPIALQTPFVAWNYICQGGVGEMLKRAIVLISEAYRSAGMRSRVALDIHDALILDIAHDEWDEALRMGGEIMRNVVPESVRQRTSPPVEWLAAPNLDENRRKWGSQQWHPDTRG